MATNWQGCKWIRDEKRAAIYERDGWMCVYCGRGPRRASGWQRGRTGEPDVVILTLDHLIPRSEGGTNDAANLVTACDACNSQRQDRQWQEYAPGGAHERIAYLIQQPLDIEVGKAIIESLKGRKSEEK